MRVLHVLHTSAPYVAGYCTRSSEILRQLLLRDIEVGVVTSAQHPNEPGETVTEVDGIRHWRTLSPSMLGIPGLREFRLMQALEARIEEAVATFKPDLIHAHSPALVGWPALRIAKRHSIPMVYEIRDLWENALVDRGRFGKSSLLYQAAARLETSLINRVDHLVTISEQLSNNLSQRLNHQRLSVVGNGVFPEKFAAINGDTAREALGLEGKKIVGYVGTFQPYEGMLDLIEAFSNLVSDIPEAAMVIVGGGGIEQQMRDKIVALDMQHRIKMTGRVAPHEVGDYYGLIDIFAYPRWDTETTRLTTPLKPLEAMAANKPVIGSNLPAMLELIQPDVTGLVCEPNNPDSIAAVLKRLLEDPALQQELSSNAKKWVLSERDWGKLGSRYIDIYKMASEWSLPQ